MHDFRDLLTHETQTNALTHQQRALNSLALLTNTDDPPFLDHVAANHVVCTRGVVQKSFVDFGELDW
jgi:uncharacterized protein (DUF488 family)